jgi:pimeloyl-ACP methyl ester carboxylesterase
MTALRYASRHSDRLAALVVVDFTPYVRPGPRVNRVREFTLQEPELESVEAFVERAVRFNPRRDPRLLRNSLRHNLRRLPNGNWTWKYDRRHISPDYFDRTMARFHEVAGEVNEIRCPTLIVRGDEGLDEQEAQQLQRSVRCAEVVTVDGAGHNVQGDNPKALAAELDRFVAKLNER